MTTETKWNPLSLFFAPLLIEFTDSESRMLTDNRHSKRVHSNQVKIKNLREYHLFAENCGAELNGKEALRHVSFNP